MANIKRGERRLDCDEERTGQLKSAEAITNKSHRDYFSPLSFAMLGALYAAFAWGIKAVTPKSHSLPQALEATLSASGVESRVTAVLLNFRAYDTLLECFVLFLGVAVLFFIMRR